MVEQPQIPENNTAKERKDSQKNRIKATFSLLDHVVRAYNNTETYIKRGLTLFGLGTVIAGASFGAGQRLPNNQVTLPQNSSDTQTVDVSTNSTPQQPVNQSPQPNHLQPQIIYLTPPPSQPIIVPNTEPVVTPPPAEKQPEPVVTPPPVEKQPEPVVTPPPVEKQPEPVVTPPPATEQQPEPVVASPPIDSPSVSEKLSQIKQKVDSVQQISGTVANIKQDIIPIFGGGDD